MPPHPPAESAPALVGAIMPERLNSAEAAEHLKHHSEAAARDRTSDVGRFVVIVEALLLSVVTVITAWAGYSAARWSTDSQTAYARAVHQRTQANRALYTAAELRNFDSSTFEAWFTAFTLDNPDKMQVAERRFRPEFRAAFEAWRATDPDNNPDAPPGPTYMPEYRQPEREEGLRLDASADASTRAGDQAGEVSDSYVRITVLLASVLFLVGIGTTFRLKQVRYGLATVGVFLLAFALILIAQQPPPR